MILLENVTKKYKDKVVLDNVNLEIDRVGLYLIKGDNGVGKSTLLNIIGGFTRVKGKVVNSYKRNMGYVFQNSFLINELRVRDNLEAFNIKKEVLKDYKMEDKIDEYVYNLSMGERQRLAFIIATREENKLILLDEVIANLDKDNESIVINKILELKKDRIIILVSHKYEALKEYVDGIIEINNRKINYKCINENRILINGKDNKKKLNIKTQVNYKLYLCYFICLFIYLSLILLSSVGKNLISKDVLNTVDYNKFYLKECVVTNNSSFSISRCSNPSESKLELLEDNNIKYGFNYDYLLVNVYNDESLSVINNKDIELKMGRYPSEYNEVIASSDYNLGDKIILEPNFIIGKNMIDIYNKELVLEVVGIYNDLLFLNQEKLYLDYDLIDNFYKEEILVNNQISLFEYFYNLDITSYKYLAFTNQFIKGVEFEGATYSYYEGIKEIFSKVESLINYLKSIIIIFLIYMLVRIYKNRLVELQKKVSFLMANSFSKIEIIKNYFKKDFFFFLLCFLFSLLFLILTSSASYLFDLLIFFIIVLVVVMSLIFSYLSRKEISRLMLEEVW